MDVTLRTVLRRLRRIHGYIDCQLPLPTTTDYCNCQLRL